MSQVIFNNRFLAPLTKDHVEKIKEWRNAQMDVLRQNRPLTDEDQLKWLELLKTDQRQSLFVLMEKIELEDKLFGYCGLTNISHEDKRAEISFLVEPKRAAQPEIYEPDFMAALYLLSQYAFEELKFNKLFMDTFEYRDFHISILEKFGFIKEATLREHYFEHGKFINSYIHSVLAAKWPGIKKSHI